MRARRLRQPNFVKLSERLQQMNVSIHRLVADRKTSDWNTFTRSFQLSLEPPSPPRVSHSKYPPFCCRERVRQSNGMSFCASISARYLGRLISGCCAVESKTDPVQMFAIGVSRAEILFFSSSPQKKPPYCCPRAHSSNTSIHVRRLADTLSSSPGGASRPGATQTIRP